MCDHSAYTFLHALYIVFLCIFCRSSADLLTVLYDIATPLHSTFTADTLPAVDDPL